MDRDAGGDRAGLRGRPPAHYAAARRAAAARGTRGLRRGRPGGAVLSRRGGRGLGGAARGDAGAEHDHARRLDAVVLRRAADLLGADVRPDLAGDAAAVPAMTWALLLFFVGIAIAVPIAFALG